MYMYYISRKRKTFIFELKSAVMVLDSEASYVLFLNTILASCCSLFSGFGIWLFRGLFHHWIFKESHYLWTTHWLYAVFNVGCIGLFVTNLLAFATWNESTGEEAYRTVFITNAVMHGIWGCHNLHQTIRKLRKQDEETLNVMRRPFPLMGMLFDMVQISNEIIQYRLQQKILRNFCAPDTYHRVLQHPPTTRQHHNMASTCV